MTKLTSKPDNSKQKYAIAKHHAWAGSILLSLVLTSRLFIELYKKTIDNTPFIIVGIFIIIYILISLGYTYKYRKHILMPEENKQSQNVQDDKVYKNQLKLEKKKQKTITKQMKKT